MKFVTSERRRPLRAGAVLWQLAQMLWVGGVWLLHIGILPALGLIGLAPLLIDEIDGFLSVLLVSFAAACVTLQVLVLIKAEGMESLWRDIRGQLLLMALYACAMFCGVHIWLPEALRWQLFSYLVLGFAGLVLVMQPAPGWSGGAREARP